MVKRHKKKLVILVVLLLVIAGIFEGLFFYVNGLVKPEVYQQQVLDAIKEKVGQDVKIKGGVRFKLFPSPQLVLSKLEIGKSYKNYNKISSTPFFSVKRVVINIVPMSIISNEIKLSSVTLVKPSLSVERDKDGTIHWGWLNKKLFKELNIKGENRVTLPLFVDKGALNYKDSINDKEFTIENISAQTVFGKKMVLNGKFKTSEHTINFVIDNKTSDLSVKGEVFPLNLRLSEGNKSVLKIQSVVDLSHDSPKITGDFNVNTDDLLRWMLSEPQISKAKVETKEKAIPLIAHGKWNFDEEIVDIQDIVIDGLNSKGGGTASLRWENWYPTIATDLKFKYIDYLVWKKVVDSLVVVKKAKKYDEFQVEDSQSFDFRKENPLPENIEIRIDVFSEAILFAGEKWGNTRMSGVLDRGAFTVNQCDIDLDGNGLLSVFGVISQGGTGDLRFEGNIEAKGKSLHKAISMFYSAASDLPSFGKGEFSIDANMYVNSGQIRLFEANIDVDGMTILGAITAFLEEQMRIEAKLRLRDINFDYIRDTMRKQRVEEIAKIKVKDKVKDKVIEAKANEKIDATDESERKKTGFDWLRYLNTRFDVAVYVDGFTFMERQGSRASFFIYAYRGELRVSNVQFTYPDGTNQVNLNLDVRGVQPYVGLMVNADRIDTSYFSLSKDKSEGSLSIDPNREITKEEYANFAIPLGWMNSFNGAFDITLSKITHKSSFMEKIKFQGRLDNRILTIGKLGFIYSEAKSAIVGTLFGGKVPGLQINFTMSNADIYGIIEPLIGLNNVSGYASLSGSVYTTGWNFKEWLQNMDSKFLVAARGVKVQGVNLAGVISAVDVAQSSADVFNNVNNALTKGTTEFSIDGYLNVKSGELRAPSLTVRSGLITGSVVGGMKLDTFIGQFSTILRFPNLSPESVPTMIIQLSGKIHEPEIKVDTASLENFVAKRNVSK